MWDWKRPSFKESVIAQESRFYAPKIYRVLINTPIPLPFLSIESKIEGRRSSGASYIDEEQYFIVWR